MYLMYIQMKKAGDPGRDRIARMVLWYLYIFVGMEGMRGEEMG